MPKITKKDMKKTAPQPSRLHIEVDRVPSGISVSVSGVISIPDFTDSAAELKLHRGRVKIVGRELSIAVYEGRTVEVIGRVEGVELL